MRAYLMPSERLKKYEPSNCFEKWYIVKSLVSQPRMAGQRKVLKVCLMLSKILMKYEQLMKRLMVGSEIYGIAARNGWSVSMSMKNGVRCYDFQRKTLSGVPFSFTAEVKDDKVSSLVNEIVSFVDAINRRRSTASRQWRRKMI